MAHIVTICGSPSEQSRSAIIIDYLQSHLNKNQFTFERIQLTDLPAEVLMRGIYGHPVLNQMTQKINQADGVLICAPVYKAAYPGVLKAFLDLLPQNIFQGKIIYPVMVGGTKAHLLALELSFKPLLHHLKGECLPGVFVLDTQVSRNQALPSSIINQALVNRLIEQLSIFTEKIMSIRGVQV